jgi:hypothetical protein
MEAKIENNPDILKCMKTGVFRLVAARIRALS